MEKGPENGKESPHSAHGSGMNEPFCVNYVQYTNCGRQFNTFSSCASIQDHYFIDNCCLSLPAMKVAS
jgi:hypothetical protein